MNLLYSLKRFFSDNITTSKERRLSKVPSVYKVLLILKVALEGVEGVIDLCDRIGIRIQGSICRHLIFCVVPL